MIQFILGGARSGKSRYAESIALSEELAGKTVFYIATAPVTPVQKEPADSLEIDVEMQSRIEKHQADRPSHWQTIETPLTLAESLIELDSEHHCIMVDCLTLWMLNLIEADQLQTQRAELLALLPQLKARIILVSNEIGLGVVPMGQLTRTFVDELGWLHQDIAQLADEVTFVTAGLPMQLKPAK